jgi:transposase
MLKKHLNTFLLGNHLKLLSMKSYKGGYLWEVTKTHPGSPCLRCGSVQTVKSGKCTTTVRDESVRTVVLWLKIHKHRMYCKDCKKTFTEPVPGIWPRRRTTQRFRTAIAKACGTSKDLATVSRHHRVSHGFVYKICYEQLEVKLREYNQKKWPEVVGLDEHFFRRKNGVTEFVSVFTDLKKKKMFEMAYGKDRHSLEEQLQGMSGRENVKVVVIDMSSSYRSFVRKFFPNAMIVADKFHVLRLLTPSIMKAGKEIHGHRQELSTRRKLLCSRTNLDYFVRVDIDRYLENHDKLNELYRWKERLFEFYRVKGFSRASVAFHRLLSDMERSSLDEVQRLLRTFKRWKHEIIRYFENGYTNGFTERMNGTGKLVQRRAFGYRNFKNYRLRVLTACLFRNF